MAIIGLRRKILDDDNFIAGCKALRDAVALTLGIDDGDPFTTWEYGQVLTRGKEGTIVMITALV